MQAKTKEDRRTGLLMVFLPRLVAIVVLIAIAVGIVGLLMASRESGEMKPPSTTSALVRTIESIHRPSSRIWAGYGTVRTMNSADVVAEVSGRVIERPESIEPGNRVRTGDLIVRLDDTDFINALDSSRQAVKSLEAQIQGLMVESEQLGSQVEYATQEIGAAKRDLDRVDQVIAQGVGNEGERDVKLASLMRSQRELSVLQQQLELIPSRRARLEAELASQRANERIASQNVDRSTIRAPFESELQTVSPRVGDWVALGTSVARVVDLTKLEIPLKVPASASAWIKQGDEVRLWVREPDNQPDQIGKVSRIAPEADASNRTMTIFVEVEQDESDADRLLPGQFVHGRVVTHDPHDRVILPRRAVQSGTVFVASMVDDKRTIEVVPVKVAYSFESLMPEIDAMETQWVALEIGHEPVEHSPIVVSLLDQVVSGMHVRIASDQAQATNPTNDQETDTTEQEDES